MAYGIKALSFVQIGAETTMGTEANATTIWRGPGTMIDDEVIEFVEEDVGFLQSQGRTYIPKVGALLELDETPATFEQLPYLLVMGVDGAVTGIVDGAGVYVYTYNLATTTPETPKTYTLECGDNNQEYQATYGYCEEFELAGAKNEAVTMSGKLRGRQYASGTKTASLAVPTVEEILFNKGKIYVDDTTIATTPLTATWLGFKLTVPTGFRPVWSGDGQLYFSALKQTDLREIEGEITIEHDANATTEIANALAEKTRLIRMVFEGTAVTSGTYDYKTLVVTLAAKWSKVPQLDDDDGDNIVTFPFKSIYNASAANSFVVVNTLSALT